MPGARLRGHCSTQERGAGRGTERRARHPLKALMLPPLWLAGACPGCQAGWSHTKSWFKERW